MKKVLLLVIGLVLMFGSVPVFAASSAKDSTVNLTVVFKDGKIPSGFKAAIQKNKGSVTAEYPNIGAVQVKGSAGLITSIQGMDNVQAVSPTIIHSLPKVKTTPFSEDMMKQAREEVKSNPSFTEPDDNFPVLHHIYQWDIKRVTNNGESYKVEKGNHDVVVGIIDTGVDTDHPDLVKNFLGGRNYVPVGGIDGTDKTETGDPADIEDRNGHGTHVAGTIAGNGMILGVAPEVGFKSYRVFGAEGGASTATVAAAIMGATDDGVDVISMSLGGYTAMGQIWWTDKATGKTYKLGNEVADFLLYKRAVKYATDHGVTVVAAAGNENLNVTNKKEVNEYLNAELGPQGYKFVGAAIEAPGSMPGVITVSATGPDDLFAAYSNYGAGFIDVTAPGGGVDRYPNGYWYEDLCFSSYLGGDYIFMAGTSMATPKVSAVAALLIAKNGKMTPTKVAQMVKDSTEDVGPNGKDNYFGQGMVQAPYNPLELGENVEWLKTNGGISLDGGVKVKQTRDGGYVVIGNTYSYTNGDYSDQDIYLLKKYPDGRVEWRKTFGKLGYDYAADLITTKDGGFLLLGGTQDTSTGNGLMYVAKVSSDGKTEWERAYSREGLGLSGYSILETSDGFMISGFDSGNAYLGKYDQSGKVIWEKNYGEQGDEIAMVVKATPDGGYLMGGSTFSNEGITHKKDYELIKVDSEGKVQWHKMFGKEWIYENINDIEVRPDGSFMLVGSESYLVWGGAIPNYIPNIYYASFAADGTKQWEKVIGAEKTYEEGLAISTTKDGNYIIAGSMEVGEFNKDIYVLKFDQSGKTLSEETYGGEYSDFATDIDVTRDGGYILTGNTKSFSVGFPDSDRDLFLLKLKQ